MAQLPNEIVSHFLTNVLYDLPTDLDRCTATRRNAALANKRFNAIAETFLYWSVILYDDDGQLSGDTSKHLRPFFSGPDRRKYVQKLEVVPDSMDLPTDEHLRRTLKYLLEVVDSLPSTAGLASDLIKGLRSRTAGAKTAVLICLFPNLRILRASLRDSVNGASLVAGVVHESRAGIPFPVNLMPLQHLTYLYLDAIGLTFQHFEPLLTLPSLETFETGNPDFGVPSNNPISSTASELLLNHSYASCEHRSEVTHLLIIFPQLRTLSITWDVTRSDSVVSYADVGRAFSARRTSLTTLRLGGGHHGL